MNAPTRPLAQQIADEAGAPQNVAKIARQLERNALAKAKPDFYAEITATAREIAQRTAEALAPFHAAQLREVEQRLVDAKAATKSLSDEQRARLAIFLIDGIDGIEDDLRVETETALAEVLSGVRT